jgi:hypothetical protein
MTIIKPIYRINQRRWWTPRVARAMYILGLRDLSVLTIKRALRFGADPGSLYPPGPSSTDDNTPLTLALEGNGRDNRCHRVIKLLLERGVDPNRTCVGGLTATHAAAARGCAGILRLLLSHGAALQPSNCQGQIPLHFAVMGGSPECVELLLQRGADPWAQDISGNCATDLAIRLDGAYGPAIADCILSRSFAPNRDRCRHMLRLATYSSPEIRTQVAMWASEQDIAFPARANRHRVPQST